MKLTWLRLCNFQSCGPTPLQIDFAETTFLLGPNGAGKTAMLQALARMFGTDSALRRIRRSDFHVPVGEQNGQDETRDLWLEAQFEFPELLDDDGVYATVPAHFAHMQLDGADNVPRVRIRLSASMDQDGEIEESLEYVLEVDGDGDPSKAVAVGRTRNLIQVHYLPARRDPADHIAVTANSMLGRALRAADWSAQREAIGDLAIDISEQLAGNPAVQSLSNSLSAQWNTLHSGTYYREPKVSFTGSDIEGLLRQLSVGFGPGPDSPVVDFKRLSDGQQSLLYLSLVLGIHSATREAMEAGNASPFDLDKLRPPVFTLVAMEEPENSLSPHYLGRVIGALAAFAEDADGQAVIATHSPSMLKRVSPEQIRYLRLDANRETTVSHITMPPEEDEAHKYVREAVQAYPELYFSRLVILGEGASEEIVLPRFLAAHGLPADSVSVAIAPLGGRHVNHFWRLLSDLKIPYLTILDLDRGRYQGGWGRIRYAALQIDKINPNITTLRANATALDWASANDVMASVGTPNNWFTYLREHHGVYFSSPLDLDFMMLSEYPSAYQVEVAEYTDPEAAPVEAVLGKSGVHPEHYGTDRRLFDAYRTRFKDGSKPVNHIKALALLTDEDLRTDIPEPIQQLLDAVRQKLASAPE